jgi:hypothetical protein
MLAGFAPKFDRLVVDAGMAWARIGDGPRLGQALPAMLAGLAPENLPPSHSFTSGTSRCASMLAQARPHPDALRSAELLGTGG